jgi:hypothetical protein
VYDGEWKDNVEEGLGKEEWERQGCSYQGQFHGGKRHGRGSEIWRNGDQFTGEFYAGVRMGHGMEFIAKTRER